MEVERQHALGVGAELAEDHQLYAVGQGREAVLHYPQSLNQVAEALADVEQIGRAEHDEFLVERQAQLAAALVAVERVIEARVDGVGYVEDGLVLQQRAARGHGAEPAAAGHGRQVGLGVDGALAGKDGRRDVGGVRLAQERTVPAVLVEFEAAAGIVASAREGPHVVQRPDHGLAEGKELGQAVERQVALVDPVQVDDVGLLHLGVPRQAAPHVGRRKVVAQRVLLLVGQKGQTLPRKAGKVGGLVEPAGAHSHFVVFASTLVLGQEVRVDPRPHQGTVDAQCRHGRSAARIALVDMNYSHADCRFLVVSFGLLI